MEEELKIFETILITKPDLTVDEIDEFKSKLTDLFSSFSDREIKCENMGVKKLAYPVKSYETGHYFVFTYPATTENIKRVEHEFRADDLILKFITVKQDETAYDLDEFPIITEHKTLLEKTEAKTKFDALDIIYGLKEKEVDEKITRTRTKKTPAVHSEAKAKAKTSEPWVYIICRSEQWGDMDPDIKNYCCVFSDFEAAKKEFMNQADFAIGELKDSYKSDPHPDFWSDDVATCVNTKTEIGDFRATCNNAQIFITLRKRKLF